MISVNSGVVNYFEGSVLLDNQPVVPKPGRFAEIKPGSEFRVEEGRAEILLTPGVYLRMGSGSSIRMVSNLLVDTKIALLNGSAIIDAAEPNPETKVTMLLDSYQVHITKAGRYRLDTLPLELRVTDGEAEVTSESDKPITVESGHLLHLLSGVMMASYSLDDDLDNWDQDRSEALARDAKEINDTPEISSLVDAAKNDPLLSDPTLSDPTLAGIGAGTGSGSLGAYPPGGIYTGTSPYGYGVGSLSSYPYSYGSGLYPYSLYPYGLYGGLYPYGLYTLPGLLVLPTYRTGITIRSNLPGVLGLGLGSLGLGGYRGYGGLSGYRGTSGLSGSTIYRNPPTIYRPAAPAPTRTAPSFEARPGRIGGVGHVGGVHR
ncbi:MAG TPA: hypothetical protein VKV17_08545 [Bryobacteraceae bacterium]|nr:hypothetical protein [Bryobacteraceae bacterium]